MDRTLPPISGELRNQILAFHPGDDALVVFMQLIDQIRSANPGSVPGFEFFTESQLSVVDLLVEQLTKVPSREPRTVACTSKRPAENKRTEHLHGLNKQGFRPSRIYADYGPDALASRNYLGELRKVLQVLEYNAALRYLNDERDARKRGEAGRGSGPQNEREPRDVAQVKEMIRIRGLLPDERRAQRIGRGHNRADVTALPDTRDRSVSVGSPEIEVGRRDQGLDLQDLYSSDSGSVDLGLGESDDDMADDISRKTSNLLSGGPVAQMDGEDSLQNDAIPHDEDGGQDERRALMPDDLLPTVSSTDSRTLLERRDSAVDDVDAATFLLPPEAGLASSNDYDAVSNQASPTPAPMSGNNVRVTAIPASMPTPQPQELDSGFSATGSASAECGLVNSAVHIGKVMSPRTTSPTRPPLPPASRSDTVADHVDEKIMDPTTTSTTGSPQLSAFSSDTAVEEHVTIPDESLTTRATLTSDTSSQYSKRPCPSADSRPSDLAGGSSKRPRHSPIDSEPHPPPASVVDEPKLEALRCLQNNLWLSTHAVHSAIAAFNPDPHHFHLIDPAVEAGSHCRLQEDFLDSAVLVLPRNINNNHWTLGFAHVSTGIVEIYDPQGVRHQVEATWDKLLPLLKQLIDRRWTRVQMLDTVLQADDFNCGVYVAVVAILHMHGRDLSASLQPAVWRRAFAATLGSTDMTLPAPYSPDIGQVGLQESPVDDWTAPVAVTKSANIVPAVQTPLKLASPPTTSPFATLQMHRQRIAAFPHAEVKLIREIATATASHLCVKRQEIDAETVAFHATRRAKLRALGAVAHYGDKYDEAAQPEFQSEIILRTVLKSLQDDTTGWERARASLSSQATYLRQEYSRRTAALEDLERELAPR